jgi:hypothetical protein
MPGAFRLLKSHGTTRMLLCHIKLAANNDAVCLSITHFIFPDEFSGTGHLPREKSSRS